MIAVGSAPDAVAIGDVTGDGRNDVVLTTGYANDPAHDFRVVVLAQLADGTLAAPTWYSTAGTYGNRPESVAVGDVTGDGKADVVVGLSGLGVQVFAQNGGALSAPTFVSTTDSHKIRLGKLDADADLDIAGVGWGTNTVTVLLNDGSGRFASSRVYPAQHGGYEDLEVGDVSGDGRADIVVMSGQLYATPNVSVLAQTANGFGAPAEYRVGANVNTQGIGIGDVTGDGRSDVVASYGGNTPSAFIAVFAQTPAGTLASPVAYTSYDIPEPVEVADLDRDRKADVVTVHGGWLRAGVYLQGSGGTLGSRSSPRSHTRVITTRMGSPLRRRRQRVAGCRDRGLQQRSRDPAGYGSAAHRRPGRGSCRLGVLGEATQAVCVGPQGLESRAVHDERDSNAHAERLVLRSRGTGRLHRLRCDGHVHVRVDRVGCDCDRARNGHRRRARQGRCDGGGNRQRDRPERGQRHGDRVCGCQITVRNLAGSTEAVSDPPRPYATRRLTRATNEPVIDAVDTSR